MQVLKVLSFIWKSGAEIYRDESDGKLAIDKASLIPGEVMQAAEKQFTEIDQWFRSWEGASKFDITMRKALHLFCGWQTNEKMNEWLCNDNESLMLLHDWTVELDKNGWCDLYSDFRKYTNEESDELAEEFYKRAVKYANSKKGDA